MDKVILPKLSRAAQEQCSESCVYVPPATLRVCVETEGAFCGSIIDQEIPESHRGLEIKEHEFATGKEWETDFSDKEWQTN